MSCARFLFSHDAFDGIDHGFVGRLSVPRSSTREGGAGTQHSDLRFLTVRPGKLCCYGVAGCADDTVGGGKYPSGPHRDSPLQSLVAST